MKSKQTFVCGVASYFGLPNSLETAPFLTEEERKFARERIRLDSPSAQGYASLTSPTFGRALTRRRALEDEKDSFRWSEVRRGLLDPQMWFSATAYFAILSGLYSFGLFVRRLLHRVNKFLTFNV
jgi:hypothetical protein